MSVFKCKMCGGTLEIQNNDTVAICEYCGTKQTLPKLGDEERANLYDRANHFRRNNDFDKAMSIYDKILNEDQTDAEAYWSIVLCRYGIEYVEDPSSHKRIPTVNRAQFTSIFMDEDYKSAIEYADGYQKEIYEQEAKAIDEIQGGILAISQKEEPFDIFICYKETDNSGRRTQDSVLANDLYHQLTQEGFKVFFAKITLEDKLGREYEPYIFAALNSAKVMVVLGTKAEHFNAAWVKNEWSRFLALIKQGKKKILIPAYKDMDPYDLPEEFSHLQAQDMSKLGFMQDLIRGIKKIVSVVEPNPSMQETIVTDAPPNAAPLLERVFMFLEDGDWQSADEYCEKVLDIDPKNAKAYLGKLMAELRVGTQEDLKDCAEPFDGRNNFEKAIRFGDSVLVSALKGYVEHINERNENARLNKAYIHAVQRMNTATEETEFLAAANIFNAISEYKDAEVLAEQCHEKAEIARKDAIYNDAVFRQRKSRSITGQEAAMKLFESISGWHDADKKADECRKKVEEIKAEDERKRIERERHAEWAKAEAERITQRNKKIAKIAALVGFVVVAFIIILNTVILPPIHHHKAIEVYGAKIQNAKVGDTFTFGTYEIDNNRKNGNENIEWQVIDKQGNKILIVSKYVLDWNQYHTSRTFVTWEECTLRKWLNNGFIDSAFTKEQQTLIANTQVENADNPQEGTDGGNDTTDKVFLLSIDEANKYFSSDRKRQCEATTYARAKGVSGSWWLRSPGITKNHAAYVKENGSIYVLGQAVRGEDSLAVRPALWLALES